MPYKIENKKADTLQITIRDDIVHQLRKGVL